jgi:hypothetical protein
MNWITPGSGNLCADFPQNARNRVDPQWCPPAPDPLARSTSF